jgi:hypothetical protein
VLAKRVRGWIPHAIVAGVLALAPVAAWSQPATPPGSPGAPAPNPASPNPASPTPSTPSSPTIPQDPRSLAIGASINVLYHLVAQALIDQYALRGPGDAENAMHELGTTLMIAASDDPQEDPVLLAAVRGTWRAAAYAQRTGTALPFWPEHQLDQQRLQWFVCVFYASEPDEAEYQALADLVPLTQEQRRSCGAQWDRLLADWGRLLRPYMSDTADTRPGRAAVRVAWPDATMPDTVRALRASRAVEQVAEDMTIGFRLTSDIVISVEPCGQNRTEWNAQRHAAVLCYDLIEAFGRIMEAEATAQPRP